MRTIKFRGKSICEDVITTRDSRIYKGDWVYGSLIVDSQPYIVGEIADVDREFIAPEFWIPVDEKTVCQFTGLHDKNGVEIYEGDIVAFENKYEWYCGSFPEWHSMTLEEKWSWLDKQPMYQYVIEYHAVEGYSSELSTQYIIIGNIHEEVEE